MRLRAFAPIAACLTAVLALTACGSSADADSSGDSDDRDTIVFASIPSENATSLEQQFANVIAVIEEETGMKVEMQNATDYAAVIEGMRADKIDIASFGPFSYVTAKDTGVDVEAIAAIVDTPDESPGYRSYAVVPADSDITDLAQLEGKNVCFVDPTSTSGFLYPSAGLLEAGLDPETDVNQVMAGGHDASALAVADGQCDAGFAFDTMVESVLIDSGQLQEGEVVKIWESEIIPGSPIAISTSTLSTELQQTIKDAFVQKINVDSLVESGVCSDAADCVLPEQAEWGYIAIDDSLYDGVRAVCDTTQAAACQG